MEQVKTKYRTLICNTCGREFQMNSHGTPKCCSDECKKIYRERKGREFNLRYRNAVTNNLNENSIEGIDYIVCPICNEKHSLLTLTHFKRHGYTSRDEVLKDFSRV